MKNHFLSLVCFAALSILCLVVSSCATAPPPQEEGIYQGPSIQQKQLDRQEAISRQQRSLMQF